MTTSRFFIATAFLGGFSSIAIAQDKKLDRSQLPTAVEKTVQMQSRGAKIKGFVTDQEGGKKVYEAQMIVNGHTKDIQIAEDGTLNEIEEVSIDSLPLAVQTALQTKAAGARIVKVESLTKRGTLVGYEASTLKGSRKGEIQVGPGGKKLSHPE